MTPNHAGANPGSLFSSVRLLVGLVVIRFPPVVECVAQLVVRRHRMRSVITNNLQLADGILTTQTEK
jgi:hypothetical protein